MIGFRCLFTVSCDRATKDNGVPAFHKESHTPKYDNIIPDELIRRIIASPKAQEAVASILKEWEAVASILKEWEEVKGGLKAFTAFLKSINVDTNIIGALKAWSMIPAPDESKISFLEFLLQPSYHHHFSALLGAEGIMALNKEIDLRGYLHEVGVLCRLLKAQRVGSQGKGSDVDVMGEVEKPGEELDPEDMAKLEELYGIDPDLTLFTSPDGKTVTWASKGHPSVVHFLMSCSGIMPPLTPEQMQELLQVRIKGFWALFTKWDLIPFLIQLGKSDEEAKAIIARAQEGTLGTDDMIMLVEAFRQGRVTIPEEQRILDKWLQALNSLLKQYLHITALVNGHCTANKEELVAHSGITGNALSFLQYVLYHRQQGAMKQEGVTDMLVLLLTDASMFTSSVTCQGPMWWERICDYARRMSERKAEKVQEQPSIPLTADILRLLLTHRADHPIVQWFIAQIKAVKEKRDRNKTLTSFETTLAGIANKIKPDTTDEMLVSMLVAIPSKDLSKLIPKDAEVLKSVPSISRETVEQVRGMLMSLDGVNARCIPYGDRVSLDEDKCIGFIMTSENADTYIVRTPTGTYTLCGLSSAITQGGDVSTLILQEKDGMLVPVEIMNFYLNKEGKKVYVKEDKGKVVHLDGTPVPGTTTLEYEYELIPATSPPLLERYAILCTTGVMSKEFRERLSLDPLNYTAVINQGKWQDLIHYIIRWGTDTLTELSVLLHMLKSINAPQSLIAQIEGLKKTRDELFEVMKQPNAVTQEFMHKWVSMLHVVFALGLHTPDVLAFMERHRDIKGLTEEQTQKIQRYLQSMYMDRLSFFKAVVFRLCQITYGLFVCIPKEKHMIYVKAELAEKVLPVLYQKGIIIPIDTLVALLHRNFSLPNDIRLTSSMHMDFEKFVLDTLAALFPHFTGQELRQREMSEQMSWLLVAPPAVPEPVSTPAPEPTPEPTSVQEASPPEIAMVMIQKFVKEAKDRNEGKPWLSTIPLFIKQCKEGHVDKQLVATLIEIAGCDEILKAIAFVAKKICDKSQPQRIEALIVLLLNNYFGHGQKAFIVSIETGKGAYNPTEDIKKLPGRIAELHKSLQAPAPIPAPASAPTCVSLYNVHQKDVYAIIKNIKSGLDIMAVFDDKEKVVVLVENDDIFHVSPLPEGTLCVMLYTHPALSRELLSSMTHQLTTPNFQILGVTIPDTSSVPLTMTKERLSYQELHEETVAHLTSMGVLFLSILRFGSSLHYTDETRLMTRDVDYRVLIPEGERKGIEFTATDGTKCDLSFTTLCNATKQHEVLIAMLLGSSWLDASGCAVEPFGLPSTLKESLRVLLPVVGTTIHYNGLKGNHDPTKTFQSIKLMVALMKMVVEHEKYPHYEPLAFFPEGFNKDAFVEFLSTSGLDCAMVVDLFTKAQYTNTKTGLKAQELKYTPTLDALPAPLKQLMLKFKEVTTKSFPNSSDKKGVSGVRTVLEYISKQ